MRGARRAARTSASPGPSTASGGRREQRLPFLGTCAGFQHGVLELARNVVGRRTATHAEYAAEPHHPEPTEADDVVIHELLCSLVGEVMEVAIVDPELRRVYGSHRATERYYCRFGLDPRWREPLEDAGLCVAGVDVRDGDVRIMRLVDHPFHVLTLFVPQTSSTADHPHPLITGFVGAVASVQAPAT